MGYTALPDRRMPYHRDGTRVGRFSLIEGVFSWLTGTESIELNDFDTQLVSGWGGSRPNAGLIFFFPEQREVTAIAYFGDYGQGGVRSFDTIEGSIDTTSGLDGTWETGTMSSGVPAWVNNFSWRDAIKPVSFTGGKRTARVRGADGFAVFGGIHTAHLYGEKVAGQTPDDIIFLDADGTGAEFTAEEDFGDRPLGTSVIRQFKVKNASATKTANNINLQCNDTDFAIATAAGGPWVVTIDIASLIAGASSATLYCRNTTPPPGALLGPRFAEIVATVGSWT